MRHAFNPLILHTRKLRPREGKPLAWNHTTKQWLSWDQNSLFPGHHRSSGVQQRRVLPFTEVHLGSFVEIWTMNMEAAKGNGQGLGLQSEGLTLAQSQHMGDLNLPVSERGLTIPIPQGGWRCQLGAKHTNSQWMSLVLLHQKQA